MDAKLLERIGLLKDKASNLLAATRLPLSPAIHVTALAQGMQEIETELRAIYAAANHGKTPWDTHPMGS